MKKRTRTIGRGPLVPDDSAVKTCEEIADELTRRRRDRRARNSEDV